VRAAGASAGLSVADRIARLRAVIGAPATVPAPPAAAPSRSPFAGLARLDRQAATAGGSRSPLPSIPTAPADAARIRSPASSTGARPAASAVDGPSLAERLARARAGRSPGHAQAIESLCRVTGAEPCGEHLLCVTTRHPLPLRHGRTVLTGDAATPAGLPIRAGETLVRPTGDLLLLDTETSGLAGGAGTFAFLLGLARVEGATLVVRQYLATRFAGEAAMLARLRAAVAQAGCIVTFNGKSFDVPLLAGRFALRREAHPFAGLPHCDLLHASRRSLRADWPDCRLRTAEERALGFERVDDMPGADVPAVWHQWLARENADGLPKVLEHNRADLVSLLALVQVLGTAEGRLPLFSGRAGPYVPETGKNALHTERQGVQRVLQDPREVEVLV
jgi:uncharacterized protein